MRGQYVFRLKINWKKILNKGEEEVEDEIPVFRENTPIENAVVITDGNKNKIRFKVTMFDCVNKTELPMTTNIPCWWCRYTFDTPPIGCPLEFFKPDYFLTEGCFCRKQCVRAYILDHRFSSKYKRSINLLLLLVNMMEGNSEHIQKASSWKLLKNAGGPVDIEEFRSGKIKYVEMPNVKRPRMLCSGTLYEELKST